MAHRFAVLLLAAALGLLLYRPLRPAAAALLPPHSATPVTLDESSATAELFVDPRMPGAADSNPGSRDLPLLTIARAAAMAVENNQIGVGTRIIITPGVYRESITMPASSNSTPAPIIFEAAPGGGPVVISGSDLWTNWQPTGDLMTYVAPWPYRWGLAPYPKGWQGQVVLMPIVRRREMVFINGRPLRQVLTPSDLDFGTFLVQESLGLIYIRPDRGVSPPPATVEVAARPVLFSAAGQENLVLRAITFQQGNTALPNGSVQITNSKNILIDQCYFANNNWIGLQVAQDANLTILASAANANGGEGMDGYQLTNVYMDRNETSGNNWRGAAGGLLGWAPAGAKFTGIHVGLFRRHKASANLARGLWLDYNNTSITIEAATLERNQSDGLFLEANEGPVLIQSSSFVKNLHSSGLAGANTTDVTVENSAFCGNGLAQVTITGDYARSVTDWSTNTTAFISSERWTLVGNRIATPARHEALLKSPAWQPFLSSYEGDSNTWRSADAGAFNVGGALLSFKGWQTVVSSDQNSTFSSYLAGRGDHGDPCGEPILALPHPPLIPGGSVRR
jgi:hypothetical protein